MSKFREWCGKLTVERLSGIIFILLIFVVLAAGLVRTVFFPKDINYYENRYSEKIIAPTLSNVMDQTFQDSIENALADQIPTAQRLKKLYNTATTAFIGAVMESIIDANPDIYIEYNGMKLFGSDQIVFDYYDMTTRKPLLDSKIANYNALFANHPELEFFVYYIEKDTDINFETGEKIGAREHVLSSLQLPDANKAAFVTDDYPSFREHFYRTDHHWNHKGSYKGYLEVLDLLGIESAPLEPLEEVLVSDSFSGSKAHSAGAENFTEPFHAYRFDYPEFTVTVNGAAAEDYGAQDRLLDSGAGASLTYGEFYGGDSGEVILDSGNDSADDLLIIGESYDNALLKLLAAHHDTTYSIDLRNYETFLGKPFDFSAYVEEHDIERVLIIGNIDFYILDTFMLENE